VLRKAAAAQKPKAVGARSALIQQEATEVSECKDISNAATDEMPQPVGSCEVIGNGAAPGTLDRFDVWEASGYCYNAGLGKVDRTPQPSLPMDSSAGVSAIESESESEGERVVYVCVWTRARALPLTQTNTETHIHAHTQAQNI